jgi:hypothetical protein
MKRYKAIKNVELPNSARRTPIGHLCGLHDDDTFNLWLMGPYLDTCQTGGCDLIKNPSHIMDDDGMTVITPGYFSIIEERAREGYHVLFEGIVAQHCTGKLLDLHRAKLDVLVIGLTTPVEICIERVKIRRAEGQGYKKELVLDPSNLIREERSVKNALAKLKSNGVHVEHMDVADAIKRIAGIFGC